MKRILKKTMIFLCFVTFFVTLLNIANASVSLTNNDTFDPSITNSFVSQYPDPVSPGEIVEVRFRVENNDILDTFSNISIKILPKYPFTLLAGDEQIKKVSVLNKGESGLFSPVVKYDLLVDKNVAEGDYSVDAAISTDGKNWQTKTYYINVRSTQVLLVIEETNLTKDEVSPNENFNVGLKLKNSGKSAIKEALIIVDLSSITSEAVKTKTTNRFYLGDFEVNEVKDLNIDMFVSPEASLIPYKIPLVLSYKDTEGTTYNSTQYFIVKVNEKPNVLVLFDELTQSANTITIDLNVVNAGLNEVKYVVADVESLNKCYDLNNKDTFYVGNIDSDDYQTLSLKLINNCLADEKLSFKININYYNDYNQKHIQEKTFSFDIEKTQTSSSLSIIVIIILLIVIAIIVFFGIKILKKRKHRS